MINLKKEDLVKVIYENNDFVIMKIVSIKGKVLYGEVFYASWFDIGNKIKIELNTYSKYKKVTKEECLAEIL